MRRMFPKKRKGSNIGVGPDKARFVAKMKTGKAFEKKRQASETQRAMQALKALADSLSTAELDILRENVPKSDMDSIARESVARIASAHGVSAGELELAFTQKTGAVQAQDILGKNRSQFRKLRERKE